MKKISNKPLFFLWGLVMIVFNNQSMEKENSSHQQQDGSCPSYEKHQNLNQEVHLNGILDELKNQLDVNDDTKSTISILSHCLKRIQKPIKTHVSHDLMEPVVDENIHYIDTRSTRQTIDESTKKRDQKAKKKTQLKNKRQIIGEGKKQKKALVKRIQQFKMELKDSLKKKFQKDSTGIIGENTKYYQRLTADTVIDQVLMAKKPQVYTTPIVVNKKTQEPINNNGNSINFYLLKNYFKDGLVLDVQAKLPRPGQLDHVKILHNNIIYNLKKIINLLIPNDENGLAFFKDLFQFIYKQTKLFTIEPNLNGKIIAEFLQKNLFKLWDHPQKNMLEGPKYRIAHFLQTYQWEKPVLEIPMEELIFMAFFNMNKIQWKASCEQLNNYSCLFYKTKQVFNNLSIKDLLAMWFKDEMEFIDIFLRTKNIFRFNDLYDLTLFKKSLPPQIILERELIEILFDKQIGIPTFFNLKLEVKKSVENTRHPSQYKTVISDHRTSEKVNKSISALFSNNLTTLIMTSHIKYLEEWNSINQLIRQPLSTQSGSIFASQENEKRLDKIMKHIFEYPFFFDYILKNLMDEKYFYIKDYKKNFLGSAYEKNIFDHQYKCHLANKIHHCNPFQSQYKDQEIRADFLFASMFYLADTMDRPMLNIEATILQKSMNSIEFFYKFATDFRDRYGAMLIEYSASYESCGNPMENVRYNSIKNIDWSFIFNKIIPQLKKKYPKAFLPPLTNGHTNKKENFIELKMAYSDFIVNMIPFLNGYLYESSFEERDVSQKFLWQFSSQMKFRMIKELLITAVRELKFIEKCTYTLGHCSYIKNFSTNDEDIKEFLKSSHVTYMVITEMVGAPRKSQVSLVNTDLHKTKESCSSFIKKHNFNNTLSEILGLALKKNPSGQGVKTNSLGIKIHSNAFENILVNMGFRYNQPVHMFPIETDLIDHFLTNQYRFSLEDQGMYELLRVIIQGKKQRRNYNGNKTKDPLKYCIKPKALLALDETVFQIILSHIQIDYDFYKTTVMLRLIKKQVGLLEEEDMASI